MPFISLLRLQDASVIESGPVYNYFWGIYHFVQKKNIKSTGRKRSNKRSRRGFVCSMLTSNIYESLNIDGRLVPHVDHLPLILKSY